MKKVLLLFITALFITGTSQAKENVKITNEMIYQKLIDIDKRLTVLETQFRDFKEETNKRFNFIDKKFESMQNYMDNRFDMIDKKFDDVNKRFEDVNSRFDYIIQFLWMITGVFTTITVFALGLLFWDRAKILKQFNIL